MDRLRAQPLLNAVIVIFICAFSTITSGQERPLIQLTEKDYEEAMQGIADNAVRRFDQMPKIKVHLKEDHRFYDRHGQLHALAFYTRDASSKPVIFVNPGYTNRASYKQMVDTVLHELTHAWVDWRNLPDVPHGHGESFLRKAIDLGLDLRSTLIAFPDARSTYDRLMRERTAGGPSSGNTSGNGTRDFDTSGGHNSDDDVNVGRNKYAFYFVSFATNAKGTIVDQLVLRVNEAPKKGDRYRWKNRSWKVYATTGSKVWLVEAISAIRGHLSLLERGDNIWHVAVPSNSQWYTVSLPANGRFHLERILGDCPYSVDTGVEHSFRSKQDNLRELLEITDEAGKALHLRANHHHKGYIVIRFRLLP